MALREFIDVLCRELLAPGSRQEVAVDAGAQRGDVQLDELSDVEDPEDEDEDAGEGGRVEEDGRDVEEVVVGQQCLQRS